MVEKKVILCAVLAIVIGIATIIPMEYLMSAQAQEAAQTGQAQAKALAQATAQVTYDPWFQINVPYIYVNLDQSGGNTTATWDGVLIQGVANFTFAPDALALNNTDARIEFYQFQVSSENGPILNMTYSRSAER